MPIYSSKDAQGNPLYTNIPSLAGLDGVDPNSPEGRAAAFTAGTDAPEVTPAEAHAAFHAQNDPLTEAYGALGDASALEPPFVGPQDTEHQSAVSAGEPDTYAGGVAKALLDSAKTFAGREGRYWQGVGHGALHMVPNAAKGALSGAGALVNATLHPETTYQNVAGAVKSFAADPTSHLDDLAGFLSDPYNVGNITGNAAAGAALPMGLSAAVEGAPAIAEGAGNAAQAAARGMGTAAKVAGKGAEAAGASDLAKQASNLGLFEAVFGGHPILGGLATVAPPVMRYGGKAAQAIGDWLREFGGATDLAGGAERFAPNVGGAEAASAARPFVSTEVPGSSWPNAGVSSDGWYGAAKARPAGASPLESEAQLPPTSEALRDQPLYAQQDVMDRTAAKSAGPTMVQTEHGPVVQDPELDALDGGAAHLPHYPPIAGDFAPPTPADLAGRGAQMGDQAMASMRQAGYAVPDSGTLSTRAELDRLVNTPPEPPVDVLDAGSQPPTAPGFSTGSPDLVHQVDWESYGRPSATPAAAAPSRSLPAWLTAPETPEEAASARSLQGLDDGARPATYGEWFDRGAHESGDQAYPMKGEAGYVPAKGYANLIYDPQTPTSDLVDQLHATDNPGEKAFLARAIDQRNRIAMILNGLDRNALSKNVRYLNVKMPSDPLQSYASAHGMDLPK